MARLPFSTGLALAEPGQGTMLAFNAAPDTAAEIVRSGYGVYATMLTRNMKQGGTSVEEVFDRVRVAVDSETRGSVIPWNVSKLLQSFTFFDRADNAPALASAQIPFTSLRTRPLRDFSAEQAYDVAIARDTLPSYQEYLTVFPDHPLAHRIRRVLAVRREALFWRDALRINSPPALWTYLRRYPKGPHGPEAARRLARLAVGRVPPSDFRPLAFDIPPPADDEAALFQRRVAFDDPDLPPPPPPPLFMLPPSRGGDMGPPPPPEGPGLLPVPPAAMIPFVRPIIAPGVILPPRGLESGYRQPRPFMAGPPGGGIVPRPDGAQQGGEVQRPSATPQMPAMSGSKAAPASPRLPAPPAIPAPVAPHPPVAPAGAAMPVPLQPRQPMEPTVLAPSGQVTVAKQASRRRDDATPRQQHPPQAQVGPQAPSAIRAAPSLGRKPRGREHSAGSPPSGLGPHTPGPSLAPSGESVAPQAGARQHRGRPECGHPDQPPCGR